MKGRLPHSSRPAGSGFLTTAESMALVDAPDQTEGKQQVITLLAELQEALKKSEELGQKQIAK
jgi:hypothetical protein